jgi:hypothetical protein
MPDHTPQTRCGRTFGPHTCVRPAGTTLGDGQTCDRCPAYAPWSIADHDERLNPVTRWYACGKHLSTVLRQSVDLWEVDMVEVRYLSAELAAQDV